MKYRVISAAAAILMMLVASEATAERPYWALDFSNTGLHYVTVAGKVHAYTVYEVTNKTGTDVKFLPIFRVETNRGQLTYATQAPGILDAIRAKHGKKYLDINEISGLLKDGETKWGVAIFRDLDARADHVKVYITGLTDRFRYLDEANRTGFQRMEWLTHWYRRGDASNRPADPVETQFDGWIWRSAATDATAGAVLAEEPVRAPAEAPEKPAEKPAEKTAEKPAA
jgi:hypothetical protein